MASTVGPAAGPRPGGCAEAGPLLRHLSGNDERPHDVQSLNHCLETLILAFPQYQPYVFRNMLHGLSEESRLAIVADRILTNPSRWAPSDTLRPTTATATTQPQKSPSDGTIQRKRPVEQPLLEEKDLFRSPPYKAEVARLLEHEFVGVLKHKLTAVLTEENFSYFESRARLYQLGQKSWISSMMRIFSKRYRYVDPADLRHHPLVDWHSGSAPSIKWTASGELNDELWQKLIVPFRASADADQARLDHQFAYDLACKLAEEVGELYDCDCCFSSEPIEYLVACDSGQHLTCLSCVKRSASEALYGQTWLKSVDVSRCTIRCIGMSVDGECKSCIPIEHFESALLRQDDGILVLEQIQSRISADALRESGSPVVQCPFCPYLEVDEDQYQYCFHSSLFQAPFTASGIHLRLKNTAFLSVIVVSIVLLLLLPGKTLSFETVLLATVGYCLLGHFLDSVSVFCSIPTTTKAEPLGWWRRRLVRPLTSAWPLSEINRSLQIALKLNHGIRPRKFVCQGATCGVVTCQNCKEVWRDIHSCRLRPIDTLQSRIEAAASAAVTRICHSCHTPFVKADGCNKIVCRCGAAVCYVCDADISQIKYQHFCPHFRESPGMPCTDGPGGTACGKCDLYVADDSARHRRAVEKAVADWSVEMRIRSRNSCVTGPVDSREARRRRIHLHRSSVCPSPGTGTGLGPGGGGGANGAAPQRRPAPHPPIVGIGSNIPPGMYTALYVRDLIVYLSCLALDVFDMVSSIERFVDWIVDSCLE